MSTTDFVRKKLQEIAFFGNYKKNFRYIKTILDGRPKI
jgi:hypothetical protein